MPGSEEGCGISVLKLATSVPGKNLRPAPLAIRACARFEQRVEMTFGYPREAPF
jgi:hypothetical protein